MSSSVYFNPGTSSSSTIPNLLELMGDQYDRSDLNDHHQVFFGPTYDHVACQALDRNPSTYYSDESCLSVESSSRAQNHKVETAALSSPLWPRNNRGGSGFSGNGYYPKSNRREIGDNMEIEATNPNDHSKNSKKWKSSKVRIMQRMMATSKNKHMGEDRQHNKLRNLEQRQRNLNNNNNNNGAIRVCSDCRTTTTPLWRSGPQGPKSLCNACGIRQRKARRAAMAAEFATDNGNSGPIIAPMKLPNNKIDEDQMRERGADCHENHPLPLKKRGKITDHDHGDQYGLSSSHNNNNNDYVRPSYYYSKSRVLARDEEEGAILLMALSCGLA